jgi:energy-coupling factor transporter ATP-binding protein EcfA2
MPPVIEFKNYSFKYDADHEDILHDVNLDIMEGDFVLIFGPSGSGKSTFLSAVAGLIPWSIEGYFKGNVLINGKDIKELKPNQLAGTIGLLLQNPENQFVNLSVHNELIFGAENLKFKKEEILSNLEEITELLKLKDLLDRTVIQLSGGEKQRVVLGSILMMKPHILLLDEPLAFLDAQGRRELMYFLKKVKVQFPNLTVLIAEHRYDEIKSFVNKIITIDNGIVQFSDEKVFLKYDKFHKKIAQHVSYNVTHQNMEIIDSATVSYSDFLHSIGFQESRNVTSDAQDQEPIIKFKKVSFDYIQDLGKYKQGVSRVLDSINFNIFKGEIIGILGPNGSGKTTLLNLIAGIFQPASGNIFYKENNLNSVLYSQYSKNLGLIFQNPESQILKNTIIDELKYGPRNFNLLSYFTKSREEQSIQLIFASQYKDLVAKIGYDEVLSTNPFTLSWGQKRRLNLASLNSYNPDIYLLDEPFTGQDSNTRWEIMDILVKFAIEQKSILIVSHDDDILEYCNRVFLINKNSFQIFERENPIDYRSLKGGIHSSEIQSNEIQSNENNSSSKEEA